MMRVEWLNELGRTRGHAGNDGYFFLGTHSDRGRLGILFTLFLFFPLRHTTRLKTHFVTSQTLFPVRGVTARDIGVVPFDFRGERRKRAFRDTNVPIKSMYHFYLTYVRTGRCNWTFPLQTNFLERPEFVYLSTTQVVRSIMCCKNYYVKIKKNIHV